MSSNLYILESQQAAWSNVSLVEDEPGASNGGTLVLNNSSGASVSLTGLEIVGQSKGATYDILNRGTDPIQLLAGNDEALAAHRFADAATLTSDASIRIYYNGLRWEILSVGGGGEAATGTPNKFPVYGPTGAQSDSQLESIPTSQLYWAGEKFTLWNKIFRNFQGNNAIIAIGDMHPQYTPNTYRDVGLELNPADQPGFGGQQYPCGKYFIDIEPVVTINNNVDVAGVFSAVFARATAAGGSITGLSGVADSYGNNLGGFTGKLTMVGVSGDCYVRSQNETDAVGGAFSCETGGNSGGVNTTPLTALRARVSGGHNGTSPLCIAGDFLVTNIGGGGLGNITEAIAVKARMDTSPSVTHFDSAKGLAVQGWTPGVGTTNKSYGIYIDNSIDVGTVEKWAIRSDSTSPSLFAGIVSGPAHVYGPTWNGSLRFATEDAVYDRIEALVLSSGVDTVSNQDVGGVKNFTSGINSTSYGAQPNAGGDGYPLSLYATGGVSGGDGGYVQMNAGNANGNHDGGRVDIIAGDGSGTGGHFGGTVTLYGGQSSGSGGIGGNVILQAGSGAGAQGTIQFKENVSQFTTRTVTWDFRSNTGNRTLTIPDKTGTVQINTQTKLKATLTPNGTGNPGLLVLENTTGVTPTIARTAVGRYTITLTGKVLDDTKLQCNIAYGIGSTADSFQCGRGADNNSLLIRTISSTLADYADIDADARLTLEIYP